MPMTFEEFRKKLAEQGGVIPSAWSGAEVQTPQQITGEFAEKFANRPSLEEMVPWADPVKRGVATPEMVAEQAQRDESMQNAEFRPIKQRELDLRTGVDSILSKPKNDIQRKADLEELAKYVDPREYNEHVGLTKHELSDVLSGYGWNKKTKNRALEEISSKIEKERAKDFSGIGYDNPSKTMIEDPSAWEYMNRALQKRPESGEVYHTTREGNLDSIAKSGIIPRKDIPGFEQRKSGKYQDDKTFWNLDNIRFIDDNKAVQLRTKLNQDMNPDVHNPRSWYQTRKPVPPQALEIETSPGVWEPLIEYMKKGKK